jgi:redox-sensitive bicupin YhaK (pirin superfamily)
MNFGVLRVLNDDSVAANRGFGAHPHDNMEIITIPLKGELTHEDNMGHKQVIYTGDVQVMSAGTGIVHSEFNRHPTQAVELFQIWLFPRERGVKPRYQQLTFDPAGRQSQWQQLLSPNPDDAGVWIHQDAWFHRGEWKAGQSANYDLRRAGNGLYIVVISGEVKIGDQVLQTRDAIGVWEVDQLEMTFQKDSDVLLLDVPMN